MFRKRTRQQIATEILFEHLMAMTGSVEKVAKGLRLGQGTVRVVINIAELWQQGKTWFANLTITFALNEERPDSYIIDTTIGIGESEIVFKF